MKGFDRSALIVPTRARPANARASYQGRTSDFHIFRAYVAFLLVHMIHDDS
jgi:hypothetical protein